MNFKNITKVATEKVVDLAGKKGLVLKAKSPEILIGIGIVGLVAGTVMTVKAVEKTEDIIDDAKDELEDINAEIEKTGQKPEEYGQLVFMTYGKTVGKLAKLYVPAVSLSVMSIGMLMKSHNIMSKRNAALMTAYKTIETSFDKYRERVVEKYGEERDRQFLHGTEMKNKTIKDENGNKTKETTHVLDPNEVSLYSKIFDSANANYVKNPEYNRMFITLQQNWANEKLKSRGYLFLNEVYDMLGFEKTEAGHHVGWVLDEDSDGYVDFGLYSNDDATVRFINGVEPAVLLDFNVDGPILPKLTWLRH